MRFCRGVEAEARNVLGQRNNRRRGRVMEFLDLGTAATKRLEASSFVKLKLMTETEEIRHVSLHNTKQSGRG